MAKFLKVVKKNVRKFVKDDFFRAKFVYTRYYDDLNIDENYVLIQSYNATSISGNPFYILKELCESPKYKHLKKVVAATLGCHADISEFLKNHGMDEVEVVRLHSRRYCYLLASAKYLVNNVTFPTYFIKKEGQVYLNTWHGTPLKALGKSMTEEMHTIGNVQRNFLMCDYILNPNKFTEDIIRRDYMIEGLYTGNYILNGYPRNHIFYDEKQRKVLKEKLDLENKKIYVYMPTWRGTHKKRNNNEQFYYIMHMLFELDKVLDDDSILYVKEHNMSTLQINFDQFEHIQVFPAEYETYEFLNIADCLITDYSSVMFDFANSGKKVILYAYDEKEYLKDRGMYIDFASLPFEKVYTTRELVESVLSLDNFKDYSKDVNQYIEFDGKNTISDILDLMIANKESKNLNIERAITNDKENVLIFTGALLRNGITTALKGILNNIDVNERDYILTFTRNAVEPNREVLRELGDFNFVSIMGQKNFRWSEAIAYALFFRLNISNAYIEKKLRAIFTREAKRVYPTLKIDYAIHYTGYERQFMNLFRFMNCKRITYVHNNLIEEHKNRGNVHLPTVKAAYRDFDKVVIIRESMKNELITGSNKIDGNKVHVAHNLNNINEILEKSKLAVSFDNNTECTCSLEHLNEVLENPNNTIFINIARFSVEKGLDNLVKAFEIHCNSNKESYLILIGGHGATYQDILKQVENSKYKDQIIVIKSLSNPHAILVKSDVFVLSSHYEGLPMVIIEALILNKPVISTAITGPKEFLEKGYGYLVEDSVEGLVKGMHEYTNNGLSQLIKFDYEDFNRKALDEFNELFK